MPVAVRRENINLNRQIPTLAVDPDAFFSERKERIWIETHGQQSTQMERIQIETCSQSAYVIVNPINNESCVTNNARESRPEPSSGSSRKCLEAKKRLSFRP